jgi:hypothetical protein
MHFLLKGAFKDGGWEEQKGTISKARDYLGRCF